MLVQANCWAVLSVGVPHIPSPLAFECMLHARQVQAYCLPSTCQMQPRCKPVACQAKSDAAKEPQGEGPAQGLLQLRSWQPQQQLRAAVNRRAGPPFCL